MQAEQHYYTFGRYLKKTWGRKIRKLSLHGSFTCPNRDGTLGRGGCTFCNVSSFVDEQADGQRIAVQLEQRKQELTRKADAYLAYFQAYTSTYGEVEQLRRLYNAALAERDVIGLSVGTRPDCVPDEVLALLADYQQQGQEVWLELGLQTAHSDTLKRINRGHDFSAYADAVARAQKFGLKVCCHLIMGLPGEHQAHAEQSLQQVLSVGVDGLKLHPLHIVSGSTMAKAWQAGRQQIIGLEEYADIAARLIQLTPADVVFHRISAHARPPTLLAPDWCQDRWLAPRHILQRLEAQGGQGCLTNAPYLAAAETSA
ncbi:TIGR01212 family radical SAM protein [Neiella marina]|uniref:TIGR01212 family radical SAM protein n=1 Tax=Neiella holothuriorum TaxID=2870530 RepID=A0ABS7EJJ9_9GAMM|nr:TIGR01212 family radical SAM protein [Neiella holothuriorum]MBW8192519.1 TIGR01212 family radical SAM protein [Neiella holothuriorum]